MKLFSAVMIGISAFVLAGCAATEPQVASADGTKVAAVKCKRSDASLGSHINRDCMSTMGSDAKKVDAKEFIDAVQGSASIPGR